MPFVHEGSLLPHVRDGSDHVAPDPLDREPTTPATWAWLVAIGCALGVAGVLLLPDLGSPTARFAILGLVAALALLLCLVHLRRSETTVSRLRVERDQLRAIADGAADALLVVTPAGEIRFANEAIVGLLGCESDDLVGRSLLTLADCADQARVRDLLARARPRVPSRERFRVQGLADLVVSVDAVARRLETGPGSWCVLVALTGTADRDRREQELHQERERFARAFDGAPIGMALTDLDGQLQRVNPALVAILGRPERELLGLALPDLVHADEAVELHTGFERMRSDTSLPFRIERRWQLPDGSTVWGVLTASVVLSESGSPEHTVCQIENITERVLLAQRLARAAIHDPLTGLANRVLFMDRLSLALERAKRHRQRVAVMFVDLDRFKVINDSLGHSVGDELLAAVAVRIRESVRPTDTVARFGGDEFTIVCDDIEHREEAEEIAQRVVAGISEPIELSVGEVFVHASLGLRISLGPDDTPDALLRDADAAMYEAKAQAHGAIKIFERATRVRAVDRHRIGNDLNRALERGELLLHYQPVVNLGSGRISGFEALLRWSHRQRGLQHPGEFIGLAEESGLIVPIGTWVLEEACRKLATWQSLRSGEDLPITMNVNVSPQQLAEPGFRRTIEDILERTGVEPSSLWLEITESMLLEEEKDVIGSLRAICSSGVRFSVDDFGTGYSSLHYLNRLPVQGLKVDRSFISGLGRQRGDTAIVESVIHLADALGLTVVAEGVETAVQATQLRSMGCELAQGYLLGPPVPAEVLDKSLLEEMIAPTRGEQRLTGVVPGP